MFAKIPIEVARDARLSKTDYRVLIVLFAYTDESGMCYPKRETMSEMTGLDTRKISASTSRLQSFGWLEKHGNGGRSSPNKYRITLPDLGRVYTPETLPDLGTLSAPKTLPDLGRGKEPTSKEEKKERKVNQKKEKKKTFKKPSILDVQAYCNSRGNNVDPERFVDYYESKAWMVGKSPMKNWQAAVRTWEKNNATSRQNGNGHEKPKTRREHHAEMLKSGDQAYEQAIAAELDDGNLEASCKIVRPNLHRQVPK